MSWVAEARDAFTRMWTAGRRRKERREAAWAAAAARFGGHAEKGAMRVFRWQSPTIDAPVGDVLVHVDVLMQQVGQTTVVYTRFRARYLLAAGPRFEVAQNRATNRLATALGVEDVAIGDEAFDRAFVVRSPDAEATRAAWTARARERLPGMAKAGYSVKADGQTVTLLVLSVLEVEEVIARGIELVAELASYGASALDALAAIEGAARLPCLGPWGDRTIPAVRLTVREHEVRVHPAVVDLSVTATASARPARALSRFAFAIDAAGASAPPPPDGVLGPSAPAILGRLGAARVEHQGAYVRVTPAGAPDAARLRAAAELAVHIALGDASLGSFR